MRTKQLSIYLESMQSDLHALMERVLETSLTFADDPTVLNFLCQGESDPLLKNLLPRWRKMP